MKISKIVACLGVGTLCVVTGGLAAPAIGAAVGTSMGLSGAAAATAGLATLGGGSLAAGGMGIAGGTALIQAVAGGVGMIGTGIVSNVAEAAKSKKQNKELREELSKANLDSETKQHVIEKLNAKIESLKMTLAKEKAKNQRNEDNIRFMQEQLDDLLVTLSTAQAVKV